MVELPADESWKHWSRSTWDDFDSIDMYIDLHDLGHLGIKMLDMAGAHHIAGYEEFGFDDGEPDSPYGFWWRDVVDLLYDRDAPR